MYDEPPVPPTTDEPSAEPPRPLDDGRREPDDDPAASGPVPPRSRTGVDPPDGRAESPSPSEPAARPDDTTDGGDETRGGDAREADADDCDDPPAYRLERLRLWRALATLAVVVARLIRSL
jgi:hypothetical protein